MTERLYLKDPYIVSFEARVSQRLETEEGPAVVFPATHFYPESGGQPFDLGTIDGIAVRKVVEEEGAGHRILHFLERFPEGNEVHCEIDWDRRRDHMQQHSGQHILSAAFVKAVDARTTSFHLGATSSTIDLDRFVSDQSLGEAERAANQVVRAGASITSRFVRPSEAEGLELRKLPPKLESLRIVEVEGFDQQACCGTHPRSATEVGPILLRNHEKFKGGSRVTFLCGERALLDYRLSRERLGDLTSLLSSSEGELVETAKKIMSERRATSKELAVLREEVLHFRAAGWMSEAVSQGNARVLVKLVDDVGPSELRSLARGLTEEPGRIVLLGAADDGRAHLVFARSKEETTDMRALLEKAVAVVGGKGGGSAEIAQGGGANLDGLPEALTEAKRWLAES